MASSIGSSPFVLETTTSSAQVFVVPESRRNRCLRLGWDWHKRGLLSKNIRAEANGSNGTNGDEDGSEGVLQATTEKSKKVLAWQSNLLQQVQISSISKLIRYRLLIHSHSTFSIIAFPLSFSFYFSHFFVSHHSSYFSFLRLLFLYLIRCSHVGEYGV